VVDERNKPAKQLYEKLGYEVITRDPKGSKVVPSEWQLREVRCSSSSSPPEQQPRASSYPALTTPLNRPAHPILD
jgi:hypothetical protein